MKVIVLLLVLCLFIGEFFFVKRSRRVRKRLHQIIAPEIKMKRVLYRALLLSSMLSLLFAFFLATWNMQEEEPRQGVAIVVDPARSLSLVKSMTNDLVEALPGVSFSLFELSEKGVTPLVPPTVDRLFFHILLDGIEEERHPSRTLSDIAQEVEKSQVGAPPWVVIISGRELSKGEGVTTSIVVRPGGPQISLWQKKVSFSSLVATISSQLQRSSEQKGVDGITAFLIATSTILAWIGFVMWRGYQAPVFMLFLCSSPLFCLSEQEANRSCRTAIELAGQGEWRAAEKKIEGLLSTLSAQKPRERILYTRALLSYLQGQYLEAVEWLKIEPIEGKEKETLYGLSLIALLKEKKEYKRWLEEWLKRRPVVSEKFETAAKLYATAPFVDLGTKAWANTLFWFEQNEIETFLEKNPFRSRISLLIEHSPNAIFSLLEEGSHYSGEVFLFSRGEDKLEYLYEKISELASHLPKEQRELAEKLFSWSDLWYEWSLLWPVVQFEGKKETLCRVISQQIDLSLTPTMRKSLASVAWDLMDFRGSPPKEKPLEALLQKNFFAWYKEEPKKALDHMISHLQKGPQEWNKRAYQFLEEVIKEDSASPLANAISQILEKRLESTSPIIACLLWKIAVEKEKNYKEQIENTIALFEKRAAVPLVLHVQAPLQKQLEGGAELFTSSKKEKYLSLLKEWSELCSLISQKKGAEREIDEAVGVLYKLRDLFEEEQVYARPKIVSKELFYKEDAVRLYQEMDRSDRALWE